MFERSEDEVREFGARLTGVPANNPTPFRINVLSTPGLSSHVQTSTIPAAFATANATLEGSALDAETGELFAWGADRSGNDIVVIATPANPVADINEDASVSPDDYLRFLELLGSVHPRADLDSNGVINAFDLQIFLDDFFRAR